jgi:hypothetical protein
MSVPFPFTSHGTGVGFGRIVVSNAALNGIEYVGVPQGSVGSEADHSWYVDSRLTASSDTFPAVLSALNMLAAGKLVYLSITHVERNFSVTGASLGLATFLSLLGIRTDVCVTGFVQSLGQGSVGIDIQEVDDIDAKIRFCRDNNISLIVPSKSKSTLLSSLMHHHELLTYSLILSGLVNRKKPPTIGVAETIGDLAFVLTTMDSRVRLSQFQK